MVESRGVWACVIGICALLALMDLTEASPLFTPRLVRATQKKSGLTSTAPSNKGPGRLASTLPQRIKKATPKPPTKEQLNPSDPEAHRVVSLPGLGPLTDVTYAGYLGVNKTTGANLFYYFSECRNQTGNEPIILWLNGGPGSSSMLGLFYENGPFKIDDNLNLEYNTYSWTWFAHMLYIDQPVGTGFSFVNNDSNYVQDENALSEQLYEGLYRFFRLHPKYANKDLYIFGESYAGKYIPALAYRITMENLALPAKQQMKLKGVGIGNGWIEPIIQNGAYGPFAFAHGLIDVNQHAVVEGLYKKCADLILKGKYLEANDACEDTLNVLIAFGGDFDIYDVRNFQEPQFNKANRYMAQPGVDAALHAIEGQWVQDAPNVQNHMSKDVQKSAMLWMPNLVNNYKVLIYNGQFDFICNVQGTEELLRRIDWPGRDEWNKAHRQVWTEGNTNQVAGWVTAHGNLTQIVVAGASHLVPMSQPSNAYYMANRFVKGMQYPTRGSVDWAYDPMKMRAKLEELRD